LSNATAIGAHAFVAQGNSMVLGGVFGVNGATAPTRVGIGTTTPDGALEISGDNISLPMFLTKYDPNTIFNSFYFVGRRARGNEAAPAAVLSGDSLFRIGADGYDGSSFHGFARGEISFEATEDWTTTATGTQIKFFTTPNGGSGRLPRALIDHSGNVGIGTSAPARLLHVANGSSGATSLSTSDFVIEDDEAAFQHFITPDDVESGLLFGDPTATIGGGIIFNNAATNNGIQFRTGGNTPRMTLDGSGSLGIGTTAPINRLTIGTPETPLLNGAVGIFNAGGTFMTVRDTTNNIEGFVGADSNGVLFGSISNSLVRIRTNNTNRLTFDLGGAAIFSGNVVIDGFTVPTLDTGGTTPVCQNVSSRLATCSSSLRYKSNVAAFTPGLELINRLRPVSFNWREGGVLDLGLVAEEVAAVEPLLTTTNAKGEVEGMKYDRVGVVLINAVKEQQEQIEKQDERADVQQKKIDEQATTIARQQAEIDALKQIVCAGAPMATLCRQAREKEPK
jgi:endosialidase-like protein